MEQITVMHLLKSNNFSGAENVVCQIVDLFKQDEIIRMVYVCPDGPIQDTLEKRQIAHTLLPKFSRQEVRKVIEAIKPDIIHAHDRSASVMASLFTRIAVVSHLHNNFPQMKRVSIHSMIYALSSYRYRKVFGVSLSVLDEFVFKRLIRNKFYVLPNVIDPTRVFFAADEYTLDDPIDLLFVGRLTHQKTPLCFLEIISMLKEKGVSFRALMLGEGELRKDCEAFISSHQLDEHVELKGFVKNPYPYMKSARLLLMPSRFEGFGLVTIESMLLGTPVLCSGAGGLSEIVDDTCGAICRYARDYVNRPFINVGIGYGYISTDSAGRFPEGAQQGSVYHNPAICDRLYRRGVLHRRDAAGGRFCHRVGRAYM